MNKQKETDPAVQAEAVKGLDSAQMPANDDKQLVVMSQAARSVHLV